MIANFSTYLNQKLQEKLPGKKAHLEAAPYRKINFTKQEIKSAKKSSVLVLFYPKNEHIYTVLMERTTYNGKHSGQISFPGGKVEQHDKSIFDTALREANEEIGIISEKVKILGQLSDVFIPVSNFHVIPIIAISEQVPQFIIETREVESIIELKIDDLIKQNLTHNKIKLANNTVLTVPTFKQNEKIIWGATALMLNEIKHLLHNWKT